MKALLILLAATVLTLSPDPVVITTTADKELIPEGIAVNQNHVHQRRFKWLARGVTDHQGLGEDLEGIDDPGHQIEEDDRREQRNRDAEQAADGTGAID